MFGADRSGILVVERDRVRVRCCVRMDDPAADAHAIDVMAGIVPTNHLASVDSRWRPGLDFSASSAF
jgi:hypothetical protein